MEQSGEESVLILIKEDTKFNTTKRITRIYTILDQMDGMRGYNPQDDQTPLEMITSGEYKFDYLMISLEYDDFNFIIQKCKSYFPNIGILVIYDKNFPNLEAKMSELDKTYGIKTSLEKTGIVLSNLKKLFQQIKTTKILQGDDGLSNPKYSFIQNISSGSQGIVDLFIENETKKLVAVKKIRIDGMSKNEKNKVAQEVKLMQSVKSPCIIEFYDSSFDNDYRYIYMEYADGGTLEGKIKEYKNKGTTFTPDEILNWIIEILLALFTLNKNKMMHRDIKPENILLKTSKNEILAKLSDLGISRQIIEGVELMTLCGTPYYVCPEIASDMKTYDYNIDIWSLGVLLYELITLKKPFGDSSDYAGSENTLSTGDLYEIIRSKKHKKVPKDTDPRLKYLIKVMLVKHPKKRFDLMDILKIDFVYERMIELIIKNEWDKCIEDVEVLFDLKQYITPCYKLINYINDEDLKLIKESHKILEYSLYTPYKKSLFSGSIPNTLLAKTLMDAYYEIKEESNGNMDNQDEVEKEMLEFFLKLLERGILIPISHPSSDHQKSLENFMNSSESAYYIFSFDNYENSTKIDNFNIYFTSSINLINSGNTNYDLFSLSQFVLKKGKYLIKRIISENITEADIFYKDAYILFLTGISNFSKFSLYDLPYDTDKSYRMICLLNIYQIMFIHFSILQFIDKMNKKNLIINYQFKDMTLTNIEIKNIIFRNNKKPPGYYFRLVYATDIKAKILSDFNDLRPLFILYDIDSEVLSKLKNYRFKNFKAKAVNIELDRVALKFVYRYIRFSEQVLTIPSYIQPYIQDFDANDTEDCPKQLINFLYEKVQANSDKNLAGILKYQPDEEASKKIESIFGNVASLLKKLQSKSWKISYY